MNLDRPTIKLAGATILAPLAVIFQVLPPILISPWYMRVDLVAIPWMICWIIFGLKPSLLSLLISAPLVGFLGPFAGGWVGATMKSAASVWMLIIPGIIAWKIGGPKVLLEKKRIFIVASILTILVRVLVTLIFNFYFAIPFFYGMNPEDIIGFFSSVTILGFVGLGAYITEVAFWNILQAVIELTAIILIGLIILGRFPSLNNHKKEK